MRAFDPKAAPRGRGRPPKPKDGPEPYRVQQRNGVPPAAQRAWIPDDNLRKLLEELIGKTFLAHKRDKGFVISKLRETFPELRSGSSEDLPKEKGSKPRKGKKPPPKKSELNQFLEQLPETKEIEELTHKMAELKIAGNLKRLPDSHEHVVRMGQLIAAKRDARRKFLEGAGPARKRQLDSAKQAETESRPHKCDPDDETPSESSSGRKQGVSRPQRIFAALAGGAAKLAGRQSTISAEKWADCADTSTEP